MSEPAAKLANPRMTVGGILHRDGTREIGRSQPHDGQIHQFPGGSSAMAAALDPPGNTMDVAALAAPDPEPESAPDTEQSP